MSALPLILRPAARTGLATAAVLLLAACGQAVDTDPAGATTTPEPSVTTASSPDAGASESASSTATAGTTASTAPAAGATGTGLSQSVVITAPVEGERLPAGPIGVTGRGTASEGTLLWRITQADGEVLSDGFTTAGANGEVGDFAIQQQVQAGTCTPCTVQVWAPDESGGEGDQPEGPASVTFTVE
ncbi:Gmad2 immunoglobulin-like domain-containing protein [Quadrisphaera sp. INWT6]|uniref:Gmad2 immunoglobulin-like domain-containing protein n=1 Tax=Quadrisphaera sp. INWT6 TaxID=2596917 RepID=UPI00189233A3|nr:Gmad2 immunoglobulin-like domain-containing protein [Quadrisphaera sp. INWT6]MBF5082464.1 hypothetical protein [Quadrisphaera sp. INWT6]